MASKTTEHRQILTAEDRTRQAYDNVKRGLGDIDQRAQRLRNTFAGLASVATLGIVVRSFVEASRAVIELEKSTLRLEAVMRATGNAAGFTNAQLERFVQTTSGTTLFSQNEIRDAVAILGTFRSVQGEVFKEGIKLATDMSTVMDQSLKSSIVQVGKALEDPKRGLSALAEVGVTFSDEQREMIENFTKMGDKMSAQNVIIDALKGNFDKTATALRTGVNGALVSVRQEWDLLYEAIGRTSAVQGTMQSFLGFMAQSLRDIRAIMTDGNWMDGLFFLLGFRGGGIGAVSSTAQEFARLNEELLRVNEAIAGGRGEFETGFEFMDRLDDLLQRQREIRARIEAIQQAEGELAKPPKITNRATGEAIDEEKEAAERLKEATYLANLYAREQQQALQEQERIDRERMENAREVAEFEAAQQRERLDDASKIAQERQREAEAQIRAAASAQFYLDAIRMETDMLGLNARARQHLIDMRFLEAAGIQAGTHEWFVYAEAITRARDVQEELSNSWEFGATRALQTYGEQAMAVAEQTERVFERAFKGMEDALVEFARTGKLEFGDLVDSIIADLIRMQVQQNITGPLAAGLSGLFNNTLTNVYPSPTTTQVPVGFATGGSFLVGGAGGTDSQYVGFMATPGERVTVETPGQQRGGGAVVVNQTVNISTGVVGTVRAEIAKALPAIKQATIAGVADAKARGGSFAGLMRA